MAFPKRAEERRLRERVFAGDSLASADLFQALMDPLSQALRHDLPPCTEDETYDSAVDAIYAYLENPGAFDPNLGRLSTYIMDIAKKRAIDRLRSRTAAERRDDKYAKLVELRATNPMEKVENEVVAQGLWRLVEEAVPNERDRYILKLMLAGEQSTTLFAEALGLSGLSVGEQRRQVKRHRDRLSKVLKRLGAKLRDDRET